MPFFTSGNPSPQPSSVNVFPYRLSYTGPRMTQRPCEVHIPGGLTHIENVWESSPPQPSFFKEHLICIHFHSSTSDKTRFICSARSCSRHKHARVLVSTVKQWGGNGDSGDSSLHSTCSESLHTDTSILSPAGSFLSPSVVPCL